MALAPTRAPNPAIHPSTKPQMELASRLNACTSYCIVVSSYRRIVVSSHIGVDSRSRRPIDVADRRRVTVMVISSINSKRTFCVTAQHVNELDNPPAEINAPGKLSKYPLGQCEHGREIAMVRIGIGSEVAKYFQI